VHQEQRQARKPHRFRQVTEEIDVQLQVVPGAALLKLAVMSRPAEIVKADLVIAV